MLLWKYLSPHRTDVLKNGLIRWAPPSQMNDPFEALPIFASLDFHKLNNGQPAASSIFGGILSLELNHIDYGSSYKHLPSMVVAIRELYGMLCLCERSDHPIMWAHYAENHTGFVIEFDCDHPYFSSDDERVAFRKISYTERRSVLFDVHNQESSHLDIYFSKHSTWSYESEWRLLKKLDQLSADQNFLFSYPRESIHRVIIGCRMAEEAKLELLSVLRSDPALAHIQIAYAVPNATTYGIDVVEEENAAEFVVNIKGNIRVTALFTESALAAFQPFGMPPHYPRTPYQLRLPSPESSTKAASSQESK